MSAFLEFLNAVAGSRNNPIGHQGQFGSMGYSVLKVLYPHIRYSVVLADMPDKHIQKSVR